MSLLKMVLPHSAVNVTDCKLLNDCPEPSLYEVEPDDDALLDDVD